MLHLLALSTATTLSAHATTPNACKGADPAIVRIAPRLVSHDPQGLDVYDIAVTVRNLGTQRQAANVLDNVQYYRDREKTNVHGLRLLGPGESQIVTFRLQRSAQSGPDTDLLSFAITFKVPTPPGSQDCDPNNDLAKTVL